MTDPQGPLGPHHGQPGPYTSPVSPPPSGHAPHGGPGQHQQPGQQPTGLKTTSIVMLIICPIMTAVAFVPCLGILNWIAIPLNGVLAIVGILGLVAGPKDATGRPANLGLHVAAIVLGVLLAITAVLRCLAGGGIA